MFEILPVFEVYKHPGAHFREFAVSKCLDYGTVPHQQGQLVNAVTVLMIDLLMNTMESPLAAYNTKARLRADLGFSTPHDVQNHSVTIGRALRANSQSRQYDSDDVSSDEMDESEGAVEPVCKHGIPFPSPDSPADRFARLIERRCAVEFSIAKCNKEYARLRHLKGMGDALQAVQNQLAALRTSFKNLNIAVDKGIKTGVVEEATLNALVDPPVTNI